MALCILKKCFLVVRLRKTKVTRPRIPIRSVLATLNQRTCKQTRKKEFAARFQFLNYIHLQIGT